MDKDNKELNMNDLTMVNGGADVTVEPEVAIEADSFIENNPLNAEEVGIPRGGKLKVRV